MPAELSPIDKAKFVAAKRAVDFVILEGGSSPVGKRVVGIHPEQPFAAGIAQRLVAGGGKTVAPRKIKHPRPQPPGNLGRAVLGAGIHDDHLVPNLVALRRGEQFAIRSEGQRAAGVMSASGMPKYDSTAAFTP